MYCRPIGRPHDEGLSVRPTEIRLVVHLCTVRDFRVHGLALAIEGRIGGSGYSQRSRVLIASAVNGVPDFQGSRRHLAPADMPSNWIAQQPICVEGAGFDCSTHL